jgi:transposase
MTIQRVEVITGKEGRRQFSDADKQQLVEEAFQPGVRATDVARRHAMDVSLLYRWRRVMFGHRPRLPAFTPLAVVESAAAPEAPPISARPASGVIEIELGSGARVRVIGTVEPGTLAAVVAALLERR